MTDERVDTRPTNVRWLVFALGCGTSWLLYVHRYAFGVIKSDLVSAFNLTGEQLGFLDATFSTCYAVFQVPLGLLVDLVGCHVFLASTIGLWSSALTMYAWAPSLGYLALAQAALGAGQAGTFPALSRVTRTWFPASVRTTVQGWVGVFSARIGGFSANLFVATFLIGTLALGWRSAIYVLAAVGIVQAGLFLALFRNSPRKHPRCNGAEADLIEGPRGAGSATERMPIRTLVRTMKARSLLNLGILCMEAVFSAFADVVFSNWIPLFLERVHGLTKAGMGLYASLPLAGGALGGVVGGILNDRLIRRTGNVRWARSLLGFSGKGLAAVALGGALLLYDRPYAFALSLIVVKFFADVSLATRWGAATDIGGRVTATVFATVNAVGVLGQIGGGLVYGRVIPQSRDAMRDAAGWMPMFTIAAGMYVACAVAWLFVNSRLPVLPEPPERPPGVMGMGGTKP